MKKMSIKPNSNYHIIGGTDILESKNERFKEYRRKWTEYPKNFIVGDFPLHLDIESTNICNLKCSYCAVTSDFWGNSKRGMISFSLYKRIIDEGADNGLCSVKFSFRGEPLLHPQLSEMVAYARKKGIMDIYFNTNGVLLTEEVCSRLIDAGLNRISVSADGWDKESFERNRAGAKFETVYANIFRLRETRKKRGVDFPRIRVQAVMLKEVKEHWDEYLKIWQPLADELGYLDARQEGPEIKHNGLQGDWACPFLWQRMVILWDGEILPCLMHGVKDLTSMEMGNIKNIGIKEAWNSRRNNSYRTLHKKGKSHKIKACGCCSYRALEMNKA